MGGGGDHGHGGGGGDFRAKVWSMPGGPYCRPKHWKRNTAIAMAGVFLCCIPIAMISAKLETNLMFTVDWLGFLKLCSGCLAGVICLVCPLCLMLSNGHRCQFDQFHRSSGARTSEKRNIDPIVCNGFLVIAAIIFAVKGMSKLGSLPFVIVLTFMFSSMFVHMRV